MKDDNSSITKSHIKTFDRFFKHNGVMLLCAFLLALVLWGIVLKTENPERIKRLTGVKVALDGEADLRSRQLVVVGDRSVVLPEIDIQISIDLLQYSKLSSTDVTATVSLRQITADGEYTVNIKATSVMGSVVDYSPKRVKLTVDKLATKKVPVEIVLQNKLPNGYMSGDYTLSNKEIEVEGATSVLNKAVKAMYSVDLSSVKDDINEAVSLTLVNDKNIPIPQKEVYGEIPSVQLSMPVFPYKEVKFDVSNCLVGKDMLSPNYEIVTMYTEPEVVKITADNLETLNSIGHIPLEKLDITGANKSVTKNLKYLLPDDIMLVDKLSKVEVHIVIAEKQVTKTFNSVKIVLINSNSDYVYTPVGKFEATVKIKCAKSLAGKITADNITLYIDVKGYKSGSSIYEPEVMIKYSGGIDEDDVYAQITPDKLNLLVTDK